MATRELILGDRVVENTVSHLSDDAPLTAGDVTVSWARWQRDADGLRTHSGRVGLRLDGLDDVRAVGQAALEFPMIALNFPKFADGRCYSHARILREQLGFGGELRAIGQVLQDQIFYLKRCGFDAFEPAEGKSGAAVARGLNDFSVVYQAAADEPLPIYRRRGSEVDSEQRPLD